MNFMDKRYSIGMDFGTLSARAVLVDVDTGDEVAVSIVGYQDAVIDDMLPDTKIKLPAGYALQNPKDYMEALESLLRDILQKSNVDPDRIIGIGVDSTASTIIPVDKNYMPLCMHDEFKNNPHSWPKLWKHHGAQKQADTLNRIAQHNYGSVRFDAINGQVQGSPRSRTFYNNIRQSSAVMMFHQ
jgi:L-ribulokinase